MLWRIVPKVRGSFSDRNNIKKINEIIQVDAFDDRTRIRIMNLLDYIFEKNIHLYEIDEQFYNYLYKEVFLVTNDDIPYFHYGNYEKVREPIYFGIIKEWEYDSILSFLEVLIKWLKSNMRYDCSKIFNELFEKEFVGYRFVDGLAVRITSSEELDTIENALNTKYDSCNKCIEKAMKLLFDREKPDYENSIKESISAVEAVCNIINESKKMTLNKAIEKLESRGIIIHPALKQAFISLYGYASDKDGIRHNMGIGINSTYEEAKFMLVSCSAFVNYLIEIDEKKP